MTCVVKLTTTTNELRTKMMRKFIGNAPVVVQKAGILKMTPWTNWIVWNQKFEKWEFNHTEQNHVNGEKPEPKHRSFKSQYSWKNQKWQKEHIYR